MRSIIINSIDLVVIINGHISNVDLSIVNVLRIGNKNGHSSLDTILVCIYVFKTIKFEFSFWISMDIFYG